MIGKNRNKGAVTDYRETPVKPAVYTMLIVVAAVAVPLGWLNQKIGAEGFEVADTTQYKNLVATVNADVARVQRMLDREHVDLNGAPMVTLIVPEIMPTNMTEAVMPVSKNFKINLSGIYWNPTDPIATINDENYHVGDLVQGHRITEIRKAEVVFEDPLGEKVVKYFYDYLK